jgi:hypothetical protein
MAPRAPSLVARPTLRLLAGGSSSRCPGKVQLSGERDPAFCLDVAGVRESARRLGVLQHEGVGWFGELVREHLRRSLTARAGIDWGRVYPGLSVDERADKHVARAARRTAFTGGLTAAGAHVGEAITLLTEGVAGVVVMPAVIASIAGEVVASAKVQIDLVLDLASIHGAPFDGSDTAELAAILELALHPGAKGDGAVPCMSTEDEILARLGRALFEEALLGLVPFVGIPCNVARSYRASRRVGAVARQWARRRAALREALARLDLRSSPSLLLEGAWLLATVDGVATPEELLVIAAVARALGCDERAVLRARLDRCDEVRWLAAVAAKRAPERQALADALVVVAGLRGPTRHPERRFLSRASEALGVTVDLARVGAIHGALQDGQAPPAG